jgi:DNA replication protein DnaC
MASTERSTERPPESLGDVVAELKRQLGVAAGGLEVPRESRVHPCAADCGRDVAQTRHAIVSDAGRALEQRRRARGLAAPRLPDEAEAPPPAPVRWGPWGPLLCEACVAERHPVVPEVSVDVRARRLEALGVPREYRDATVANYETRPPESTPAQQALFRTARAHARFMVEHWRTRDDDPTYPHISLFAGEPGGGKGHLEWAIAKAVAVDHGADVIFVTLSDLIRDLRSAWQQGAKFSEAAALARYRRADLLVIDEVSTHAFHGEPVQHLYDVVAWRSDAWRTTIISSNHPIHPSTAPGALPPVDVVLGHPLYSRLQRWNGIVEFPDYDYRLVLAERVRDVIAREEARVAKGPRRTA